MGFFFVFFFPVFVSKLAVSPGSNVTSAPFTFRGIVVSPILIMSRVRESTRSK